MNPIFLVLTFPLLISAVPASAQFTYQNPVIPGDHPDPSIIRVGNDYWATATSSEWGPEFPLLHSIDLVNWKLEGAVFAHRPAWARGNFWAPEISVFKGRYHIYYVARKKDGPLAVAVATADNPAGPYTDRGPLVAQDAGSIDPVPFNDEKGNPYLIWKEDGNSRRLPTIIWAQPLDESGTRLLGQPKELIRNDAGWEGAVVEGAFVVRRGEWFYLFYSGNGCCGTGCTYALGVARSHSLMGPWEKNPANPILAGNNDWRCPGHGSIVNDEQGRYWLLYHAYAAASSVFTGREGLLDEVKFGVNDWPTINDGKGPSSKSTTPIQQPQRKGQFAFEDDFSATHLRPDWQWPQDNEPGIESGGGRLKLSVAPGHGTNLLAAILALPCITADYTATTVLDTSSLKNGDRAGLSAFGDGGNAMGLTYGDGKLVLWHREKGNHKQLTEMSAPKTDRIFLRLVTKKGYRFQFASSPDGKVWTSIGEDLPGTSLPPWDRSIRVALTTGGSANATAVFHSLKIIPQ